MKRYILPAMISLSLIACKNDDKSGYLPGTTAAPSTQQSTSSNSLQPNVSIQPQTTTTQAVPQTNTTQTVVPAQTVTTNTATATPTQVAKGMNPPHGQPGHRCDIEVGAPLNSKPKANTTTTTAQATPQILPAPSASTTTQTVAAGMNPAHGQPGHRCDIAVGAPLNSKPAQQTPPQVQAVKKDSTSNK